MKPCQQAQLQSIVNQLKALNAVEVLDNGYIKTFLISDERNSNGWRVSWDSIKKNAKTFIGKPGIEYQKCGQRGCLLDHTGGEDYEDSLHQQERYRVSTITDVQLDEGTHTAYAIHKIENPEFAEKIKKGEIRYLSPSIWPNKEKTLMYRMSENDEWYIDTTDWTGIHDAFVDIPAFGSKAKVVKHCTEGDCRKELLNPQLTAAITLEYAKAVQKSLVDIS